MSKCLTLTTGDDTSYLITLTKDGVTFDIPLASTVSAAIVSMDKSQQYIPDTAQTSAAPADWPNSLVTIAFSSALTGAITYRGRALLEIQVDDNGKITWFGKVLIQLGTVA